MSAQATFGRGSENLRSRLLGHGAGIALMSVVFGIVIWAVSTRQNEARSSDAGIQRYLDMRGVDFGNPIDRTLFRESLEIFHPGRAGRNDSLLRAIDGLRQRQFSEEGYKVGGEKKGLTWTAVARLTGMYLQFLAVYAIVLVVIYVVAQRAAIYRFVKMKQRRESYIAETFESFRKWRATTGLRGISHVALPAMKALVKGILLMILFSPAYVIAYSLKTAVDTSSLLFMIVLATISNGVLIHTSNKLFEFLVAESRKGYVQTAIVKNLHDSYEWNTPDGIPIRSLLRVRDGFRSHVFNHVFLNARFQFIPAMKEYGSFLVTGLIIIEMALNIQGHLCYELLQQVLYRQYDLACIIVFGIFLAVKATEITVDIWHNAEKKRYGY